MSVVFDAMKILVLEHEPDSPAGFLVGWARRCAHSLLTLDVPRLRKWPDPSEFDAVVSLGSDCSVHGSANAWIEQEIRFLRRVHQARVPALGICFGAQALAAALGGRVSPAELVEIGWVLTDSDEPELVPPGPWFSWHEDVFSVPAGGREIARSGAGPAAFASGLSVGVQFHPEVDSAVVRSWVDGARERIGELSIDEDSLLANTVEWDAAQARAEDLFDRIARHWQAHLPARHWPARSARDGPASMSIQAPPAHESQKTAHQRGTTACAS